MATEIATAYISLIPSTSKIAPAVRQSLGDVEKSTATTSRNMGSSIATGIGTGVATVTSLLGGLALKGGFTRALAIDNAQAKMKALGYSGEQVQGVMDTALASVKGTAFGLGDAASLATQLIAGGIKPGQDLARALGNTADIAAVANVSLGDLSPVMGQLASSSHLYTQDLLQLQQRGLPVFSWLADSLGTTQSEVRDMVSKGKIDFAQLQTAIEQHVGGAAKATDSFKASWSNVLAALSRTGAVVATPTLAMLKGVFDQAIPAIDAVTAKITPLVSTLADRLAPAVADLSTRIGGWVTGTSGLSSSMSGLLPVLGPVAGLLAALGGSQIVGAFGPLAKILPTISGPMGLVLGTVAALLAISPELRTALGDALFSIGGALQNLAPLLPVISGLVTTLAQTLGGVLGTVLNAAVIPLIRMLANTVIPALLPALTTVMGIVGALAVQLGGLLTQAILALVPPIMAIVAEALPVLVQLLGAILPVIMQVAMSILPVLAQLITLLAPIVTQLVQAFLPLLPVLANLVTALLPVVMQLLSVLMPVIMQLIPPILGVVQALVPLIAAFVQIISAILPPLTSLFTGVLVPAIMQVVQVFLGALMPVISSLLSALQGLITFLTGVFTGNWSQAWSGVKQMFTGVWDTITNAVSGLGQIFGKVPGIIMDAFSGATDWLRDIGGKIIDGLINGIRGAFDKVKNVLSNLTSLLPDWKGPATVDAKLLTGNGQLIMQSLVAGFENEAPAVRKYLAGFTTDLAATGMANVNITAAAGSANAGTASAIDLSDRSVDAIATAALSIAQGLAVGQARTTANSRTTQARRS